MDHPTSVKPPLKPDPGAAKPPTGSVRRPDASHPGTNHVALAELRNAAATYDFLRKRGDPAEFWEMLRLARSQRAVVAPAEGEPEAPAPEIEASILTELDLIRRQHGPLVRDLRRFLKQVPGLPEPADRLEMALAFLLASTREHQAVARWVAEPDKHGGKAAEKLKSLAAIANPYREALRPWTLDIAGAASDAPSFATAPAAAAPKSEAKPSAGVPNPSRLDPEMMSGIRLAYRCRELLSGVYLEADLWETLLLATGHPEPTKTALDQIHEDAESERLDELEAKAEVLFKKVAALRSENESWVNALKDAVMKLGSTPKNDPQLVEIALALMVSAPGVASWAGLWLKDPESYAQEAAELWSRSITRAKICRTALASSGS